MLCEWGFPGGASSKEPVYQCRRHNRQTQFLSLSQGNPLEEGMATQYSCLKNPMDRGAWWATVHRVEKSQTQLKWLGTQSHYGTSYRYNVNAMQIVASARQVKILLFGTFRNFKKYFLSVIGWTCTCWTHSSRRPAVYNTGPASVASTNHHCRSNLSFL